MPHPDYARQYFICVLSASDETWATILSLLNEAYGIAERRYERRSGTG
jgi:hypothetical protein